MGLRSMLQRHKKTGVYYFRRRVPTDLVQALGKSEFKESLHTKQYNEASQKAIEVETKYNAAITQLRAENAFPLRLEEVTEINQAMIAMSLIKEPLSKLDAVSLTCAAILHPAH